MLNINVCVGSACHIKGSYNVIQTFLQVLEQENLHSKAEVKMQFCMKQCQKNNTIDDVSEPSDETRFSPEYNNKGVSVSIEENFYNVTPENAKEFFKKIITPKLS